MPKRQRQSKLGFRSRKRRFLGKKKRKGRNAIPRVLRALVERKHHDHTINDQAVTSAGAAYWLSDLAQGDLCTDREGKKITATSLKINMMWHSDNTALTAPHIGLWRVMVVVDKTPNGEALLVGDLVTGTSPTNVIGFRNWDDNRRYKVLSDKRVRVTDHATITAADVQQYYVDTKMSTYSKALNLPIEWTTGGSALIGATTRNHLYLVVIPAETNNDTYFSYRSRLTFVDM